jgi:hypothetical protein
MTADVKLRLPGDGAASSDPRSAGRRRHDLPDGGAQERRLVPGVHRGKQGHRGAREVLRQQAAGCRNVTCLAMLEQLGVLAGALRPPAAVVREVDPPVPRRVVGPLRQDLAHGQVDVVDEQGVELPVPALPGVEVLAARVVQRRQETVHRRELGCRHAGEADGERERLVRHPKRVDVLDIRQGDRHDVAALVDLRGKEAFSFQHPERFSDGSTAEAVVGGDPGLGQLAARGQLTAEDPCAQVVVDDLRGTPHPGVQGDRRPGSGPCVAGHVHSSRSPAGLVQPEDQAWVARGQTTAEL